MKHILIIASYGPSLINFRLNLIKKLISKGYKVSVASPKDRFSDNLQKELKDLGVNINIFSLSSVSLNFFKDYKTILEIFRIIKISKPNIIISYTAKPVIYTGLVLKYFKKISYFPMINIFDKNGNTLFDKDRLTKFGQFLRSICLGELPELWNVLKGEMSLVAPRPLLEEYLPLYSKE